ncbi:hypothetical protein HYPSUDRAFT_63024 [Hypholoma sublateritium FD-334 SS-4]|uniref:Uncharacterized protein n=1 Tax=Hypholoma sublateritium (strain FD-334 SS-4) TaxID=945553 RepID=A0A0D2PFL2_HYPSF|nr:hypothetical protein HYPSUDRAFT_63024 [Hypholoma sublateritium FD-334 SS-4]
MQHASAGVRNASRKGPNTLLHHGGFNGPGSGTANKSIHTSNHLQTNLHVFRPPLPPRNPAHQLFSASKNFLQRFFTHLTAPGLRAPHIHNAQNYSSRSLHGTSLRGSTIQSGLSLPVRNSLRNHAIHRQANVFLPRGPGPVPPRCGGIAQVGLGIARNFSTARPIFEQLVQNVPIAARALYELDFDMDTKKAINHMRLKTRGSVTKKASKSKPMLQENTAKRPSVDDEEHHDANAQNGIAIEDDIDRYFASAPTVVTTYISVPLAPTPTSRAPLPADPVLIPATSKAPSLLPPLSFLASLHASHSTHALRVDTLFTRLDQANVWARGGVRCYAYSQGLAYRRPDSERHDDERGAEGVCTALVIEFKGWTKNEVRSAIGESGTGWCMIEEVCGSDCEDYDSDSLSSSILDDHTPSETSALSPWADVESPVINPAESFILPSLDMSLVASESMLSASHLEDNAMRPSIPVEMEIDPWIDESASRLSSPLSSCSDLSDLVIDPPTLNGWIGVNSSLRSDFDISASYTSFNLYE